jgi:hypothetical protein
MKSDIVRGLLEWRVAGRDWWWLIAHPHALCVQPDG